jgi:adenylate cyclase class 2
MPTEIEAKLRFDDFDLMRKRLVAAGARRRKSVFEVNTFFDTRTQKLLRNDKGLRLRENKDDATGKSTYVITVKGPQLSGALKSREEHEINVEPGPAARELLLALGYEVILAFEKRRETWLLDDCHVELDELPVLGKFVEIEGADDATVFGVRKKLELDDEPLIRIGYSKMLADYLRERGTDRREVRF